MLTHAPTVQRSSFRLLLCLSSMDGNLIFFTGDVSQVYVQSNTTIQPPISGQPPASLGLSSNFLLRTYRPLYGLPEARVHWFKIYHQHHCETPDLQPSILDPCFLYTPNGIFDDFNNRNIARGFKCL